MLDRAKLKDIPLTYLSHREHVRGKQLWLLCDIYVTVPKTPRTRHVTYVTCGGLLAVVTEGGQ